MQGFKRKIVYVTAYEVLALAVSSTGLAAGSGSGLEYAGVAAVMASAIAIVWNLVFNTGFEFVEARMHVRGRTLGNRIIHALCLEGGLVIILAPVFAWWLQISFAHALALDVGLSLFFVCYTFVYNWAFDRVFGLPTSARGDAVHKHASDQAAACSDG